MSNYLLDRLVSAVGDQYRIDGEIGRGGMAAVFSARDARLNRPVAIKALPPELAYNQDVRTRFLREAQMAAQLHHPNIVPIYSVDERDGLVYFVMALVEGESLAARLTRERRLDPREARRILNEVADALQYAHEHGVVHRDVKPDNILLDRRTGRPMVTDFGIARAAAVDARLTATGVAVGTPAYMSPEQAIGERELDGRSDQYSLGVVGYQMLAGQTPFVALNTPAMLVKHVSERPVPLSEIRGDVPPPIATAIDRALAKRPEDRWRDLATFRAVLDGRVALESSHARSVDASPRGDNGSRRPDRAFVPAAPPIAPPVALPPMGLTRRAWRQWSREQRRLARDRGDAVTAPRKDERVSVVAPPPGVVVEERRVLGFRRQVVRTLIAIPAFILLNAATGGEPWFIFVVGAMLLALFVRAGGLWADGISPLLALRHNWRDILLGRRPERARDADAARLHDQHAAARLAAMSRAGGSVSQKSGHPAEPARAPAEPAASLAAREVLEGAHGATVRRAAADRDSLRDIIARLTAVERELLPDVAPTAESLAERVGALATALHRLDADIATTSPESIDARIEALRAQSRGTEGDRQLLLLERQRATINDLTNRRQALAEQLESAGLALQNLRLDLLKLRSAGIDASIRDVTSATVEARALSRDISNLLDAHTDVRNL